MVNAMTEADVPRRAAVARVRGFYAILDRADLALARALVVGAGATVLQVRLKPASTRELLAAARMARQVTRAAGAMLVVNDRVDVAIAAEADGVHLGQDDLPPARLPAAARARLLVGRSTHTLEQARAARAEDVDYAAFGPVFGTASKESKYAARGLALLAEAARAVAPLPLVAIGGIDLARAASVRAAGAAGVAVISVVAGAGDPVAATRALVAALRAGTASAA